MASDLDLKFVSIEDLDGLSVAQLGEMASETDRVKAAVQSELKRRADEALETLRAAGYGTVPALSGEAPKKRGPKPKGEKAEATPNGHAETLSTAVPAEIARQ